MKIRRTKYLGRVCALLLIGCGFGPAAYADVVVADPHRFDEEIAAIEAADEESMRKKGKVLFLGSSSIRRWNTDTAFAGIDSLNRGFGGSQTSDAIYFFDRIVTPYAPSVIVFYEGDNDMGAGKTIDQVVRDFRIFGELVEMELKDTKIVYIPIKPSIKRAALWSDMAIVNERIRAICEENGDLYYADTPSPMLETGMPPAEELFVADGLHISDKGYAMWARVVRPVLEQALRER